MSKIVLVGLVATAIKQRNLRTKKKKKKISGWLFGGARERKKEQHCSLFELIHTNTSRVLTPISGQ